MAELPHPWGAYAHLQDSLQRDHRVGDRSWGTEAGMARILRDSAGFPPTFQEIDKTIAAGRRRERHRGARRVAMPDALATPHPDSALVARHELAAVRRRLNKRNWHLLTAVAAGHDYKEIARAASVPEGTLRVQVLRLRQELAPLVT